MTGLKINFADVQEKSFDLLPAGKYPTAVDSYDISEVATPGKDAPPNPMKVEWVFNVIASGNPLTDKYVERKLWTNTTLYGGGLGRLKNLLKCLGFEVDRELDLDILLPQTVGKQVISAVRIRKGTGEYADKNDISGWSPYGDGATAAAATGSKSLLPG